MKQKQTGLEAWKRKYYPVPAGQVKTMEEALRHTLKKWEGLSKKALGEFELTIEKGSGLIRCKNGVIFCIDFKSCALCVLYYKDGCDECPIKRCCGKAEPFSIWHRTGNTGPMLARIKKAIKKAGVE